MAATSYQLLPPSTISSRATIRAGIIIHRINQRMLPKSSFSFPSPPPTSRKSATAISTTRRDFFFSSILTPSISLSILAFPNPALSKPSTTTATNFFDLPGGIKALDLRLGSGDSPINGDQVAIHYYGRLAAKQGWRFDSTYDHKDKSGESLPFVFILGISNVIPGVETAVRSMKVGGIRRVIIPPSQGYQNTEQEPLPPDFFDRQRLFTTIFNPTRLANGEGGSLGTLLFDIELVNVRRQ